MKKILCTAAAALLTTVAMPASAATTILTEDFTTGFGAFSSNGNVDVANGLTYSTCCQTDPTYLNNFAAFDGGPPGSGVLTATLQTVLGRTYTLSLRLGTLGGGTDPLTITTGATSQTFSPTGNNNLPGTFQTVSFNFLGTGSTTGLSFSSAGTFGADAIIDDVVVTAVPEPATWAMMLLGFGMVGFGLRSRSKVATRVTYA